MEVSEQLSRSIQYISLSLTQSSREEGLREIVCDLTNLFRAFQVAHCVKIFFFLRLKGTQIQNGFGSRCPMKPLILENEYI